MGKIPIFAAERAVPGLEEKISNSSRVQYACQLSLTEKFDGIEKAIARIKGIEHAKASENDFDLHYLKSVLTSTVWNLNDEVFDPYEVWAARHTPEDKQLNLSHNCAEIIGHITGSYAVNDEGEVIPDDTVIDDLPAKYHIVATAVIYKYWSIEALQERMDNILAEIEKGEWFVSMECLFHGFDYVLRDDKDEFTIVSRNEKTAFLSKHLRAYGGTGTYENKRVGRLPRNIVFSGKGLVKKPANPESVILAEVQTFNKAQTIFEINSNSNQLVYSNATVNQSAENSEKEQENKMADTIETLTTKLEATEKQLAESNKTITELRAAVAVNDTKKLNDELTTVKANIALVTEAKETAEAALKSKSDELAAAAAKLNEVETSLATVNKELGDIKAEQKVTARIAIVSSKLKIEGEPAKTFVESLASLSDDQFNSNIETLVATVVQKTPKTTPAALPPKATNKPIGGSKASQIDPAAVNASTASLDNAEPEADVALAQASQDAQDIGRAVASFFGYEDETSK